MTSGLIAQLVIYMVVLLLAISAHEAAHAWMSYKFGDDTARLLGRITLNPVAHTDPIGTLLIPVASFIFAHMGGIAAAIPLIGWGKPIAGILANLILASIALILLHLAYYVHLLGEGGLLGSIEEPVVLFLFTALTLNVSLAVFNLLPFPPLDGSKVLWTILPDNMKPALEALERFGFIILLLLMQTGFFGKIFAPVWRVIIYLLPDAAFPTLSKLFG
ncbi:MAG: site-2 protease family protein [Acidobacteria bacterium]|nr:MAG: site-2 protease family protein [Acidobacteriota bacterium]